MVIGALEAQTNCCGCVMVVRVRPGHQIRLGNWKIFIIVVFCFDCLEEETENDTEIETARDRVATK